MPSKIVGCGVQEVTWEHLWGEVDTGDEISARKSYV